jgi:hypothetical protein
MLNARFRPLDHWPVQKTRHPQDSQFRSTYPQTLDLLESELSHIHARAGSVVIQVENLTLSDIRNDGWPRGGWNPARGNRQGVIVSFESGKGAMSFPCDRFKGWQDNLRAIAKSLEALRMVDRYGVTRGNEQYKGWAQIEAPKNGAMDREEAIVTIASILDAPRDAVDANPAAFIRQARIRYHPDSVTDPEVKKYRSEMSILINRAGEALRVTKEAGL